ncbi:MAG: UDP-3-O-(3-hydroxymyristoyl)glucosamine N-acyltransferase [Terriglobales bacterium]
MKHSIAEVAELIGARVLGDATRQVGGLSNPQLAGAGDLVFVEDERHLREALDSLAGAIIAGEFAASVKTDKPLLVVKHPKLAFARAAALIAPPRRYEPGVHSTALIHHSVKLGKGVTVQPHAVLTDGVVVGDRTRIGPGTAVGHDVQIGANCNVAANVTIYPGTRIGDRVIVHGGAVLGGDGFGFVRDPDTGEYVKFPQVGTLEIEDDVEIGSNTTIDRGALGPTVVGRGTKIDNLVQIAHNVRIGRNVVIAAQSGISGSCVIEDDVIIGGQVGVADHCRIERGVILGAQCGVPSNKVLRGAGVVYWGTPARPIKGYLKELALLSKLARK